VNWINVTDEDREPLSVTKKNTDMATKLRYVL
jgi:hypothetical protein